MLVIVIAVTVLVLAFAGILIYKSVTEELDAQLINEEKSEYMVMNVPKNYTFRVSADTGEENLEVVDIDGNHVRIEKKYENGEIKVKAPANGYKEGKIYTLDASNVGTFRNKGIEGARAITFVVERDNTVNISYTDKVKDVESKQVVLRGNKLRIDGMYSDGDVVLVDTDNDNIQELYKLENVENNAGSTVADYEMPEGDEVYDDIDIFYYDKINMDDIVIDEDELIKKLDEFGILDLVFDDVYAAETPKGKLKVDVSKNGGKAECKFNIDVKMPNDNQKLTITFTVSDSVFYTADKKYVTFNNTLKLIGDIEFNVKGDNSKKKENNIKEAIKQYNTDTSGEKNPISDFEIPLLPVEIPLSPVTPVFLNCELGIKGYVKMDGNLNMGAKQTVTFTQGITINYRAIKTKKKYSNVDSTLNAHVDGSVKMNCYAGVYIEVGVTVPCLVTAGVDGSMGPYLDAEGYMSITGIPSETKFKGFYDVDIGIKTSSDAKIKALMFKEKTIPLIEQNKSLWHKSNKTAVESVDVKDKYYLIDGHIDVGKLYVTYKDVLSDEEEKLPMPEDYEVAIDEKTVEVKEGVVSGVDEEGRHTLGFEWKRDGVDYSFEKTVTLEKAAPLNPLDYLYKLDIIGNIKTIILDEYGWNEFTTDYGDYRYKLSNGMYAVFPIPKSLEEEENGTTKCDAVTGTMEHVFGINRAVSIDEFVESLKVDCDVDYYQAGEDPEGHIGWVICWDEVTGDYQKFITINADNRYDLLAPDAQVMMLDKRFIEMD